MTANQIQVDVEDLRLTSKLIEGRFPDYERVIPDDSDKVREVRTGWQGTRRPLPGRNSVEREVPRSSTYARSRRAAGSRRRIPEQEEAEEEVEIEYSGAPLEIGFNVSYLLDALDAIEGASSSSSNCVVSDASGLIHDAAQASGKFVVMPMRLLIKPCRCMVSIQCATSWAKAQHFRLVHDSSASNLHPQLKRSSLALTPLARRACWKRSTLHARGESHRSVQPPACLVDSYGESSFLIEVQDRPWRRIFRKSA